MSKAIDLAKRNQTMTKTKLQPFRQIRNEQPEMYDMETETPDLSGSDDEDPGEAELYCFEDFFPAEPVNIIALSAYTCGSRVKLDRSGSMIVPPSPSKRKQLHRSKTLPIIHVQKVVSDDEPTLPTSSSAYPLLQPGCDREADYRLGACSPASSEYSGSCGSESGKQSRKQKHSTRSRPRSLSTDRRRIFHKSPQDTNGSAWNFEDDTDSTTSSETMTSVSDDGPAQQRLPSQLYYTTPPKVNMVRNQDEKRLEGSGGFYRITRRLSQKDKVKDDLWHERQRSVSLDCGDGRTIKVFMTDSNNLTVNDVPTIPSIPSSPSLPVRLRNMNGLHSPNKITTKSLNVSMQKKRGSTSSDPDNVSPSKTLERKKVDKEKKQSYDNSALFEAVEQQDIDLAKSVLESDSVDINSFNSEYLTPLDVAIMTNNIPMAKMLLYNGAKESPIFQREDSRLAHLDSLVSDAERKVVDLSAAILNASSGNSAVSNTQQKENEKQLSHWEFRHKLLKRMKAGYDHARVPDPPSYVSLSVASSSSLCAKFDEPLNHNGAVVTKYKVEWSCFEDFVPLAGEDVVENMRHLEYEICGLVKGNKYYVRVTAWNMKGYGPPTLAKPAYAVPSSWRDVDGTSMSRTEGKMKLLDELFYQVKMLRPSDASELKENVGAESPQQRKRKSIKNLFTSAPKFNKSLKRGVYLACLLYHGDKVLVTSDDQLPIIEVDENFTGPTVYNDLHWLMKVSCTWDDVKSLRQDMDKNTSAGTMHFRSKLLQAVSTLQGALCISDLGQFHHKPLKDINGSVVLATVNNVKDPKLVALSSGKWVSFGKLLRRSSGTLMTMQDPTESDILVSSLADMILYHQVSTIPLSRGLYVGYLKLQASVDLIRLLVPCKAPNTLPNVKIRDCPNVSREEWEWLQTLNADQHVSPPTSTQTEFRDKLLKSANKLFNMLDISENFASSHRMYDMEIIEFSSDVTFILILPPVEDVCIVPGQSDDLIEKQDFTLLPVQVFEMIHMCTYRASLFNKYCRLSSILEMDFSLAQQAQREAFSGEELCSARKRVELLNNLQQNLDKLWKGTRWVMDIITYARDKTMRGGIQISALQSDNNIKKELPDMESEDVFDNNNSHPCSASTACDSNEISVGKDNRKIAKFFDPNEEISSQNGHVKRDSTSNSCSLHSGILQVYAAYDTGLSKGTRVRLHVTSKTTAREVVNLVVRQLNKALTMKGRQGPVYSDEQLYDFCLVAVIGARERILRDDYQPLQLQNPWTKGRLYVRLKNNLLAAIQQGHATEV